MKKLLVTAALVLVGALAVLLFASFEATSTASGSSADPDRMLAGFGRAQRLFPLDADGFEQAGTARLTRAVDNISDFPKAKADIVQAGEDFRRALALNPCSATAHFYYARTLDMMKYFGVPAEDSAFAEFQRAADLAGPNRDLSKQIGLALAGQWDALSGSQRAFVEGLLHQSLVGMDAASFGEVLYLWYLNIRDYAAMDRIIPPSADLERAYARFLGERSLDIGARHRALAAAESLDYDQALKECETAQNLAKFGQTAEAIPHLTQCLGRLRNIKHFVGLLGEANLGAEVEKKNELRKTASLELAKDELDQNRKLEEADGPLRDYLALEENFNQVTDLESYLRELRLIPENESEITLRDVRQLSFEVYLMFKLHKYRQIISLGSQLERSLIVPEAATRAALSEVFALVGDSYLKLDFVYESEGFYQKALELTPDNIEVLFRMKKYYERRNDADKVRGVDRQLAKVLTGGSLLSQARILPRDAPFDQTVVLGSGQKKVRLEVQFGTLPSNPRPLVGIYLNDRVCWEDYVNNPQMSLEISPEEGVNHLQIVAVNGPAAVLKLNMTPVEKPVSDENASLPAPLIK